MQNQIMISPVNKIDLSHKEIVSLAGFEGHRELKALDLSFNLISQISFIPLMPKIQELYLNGNSIQNLSAKLMENCRSLQILELSKNKLTSLEFVNPLKNLQKLDVSYNQINNLISLEGPFPDMESIYLGNNQIDSLEGLSKLFPNLFVLSLPGNQICVAEDFDVIEFMEALTEIDARGNICCQNDEKEFIDEMRETYPFLEQINGIQIQQPGQRFRTTIQELVQDIEDQEKLQKKLNQVLQFDSAEDEIEFNRILQEYQLNPNVISEIDDDINSFLKEKIDFQQEIKNQSRKQKKDIIPIEERDFMNFLDDYKEKMINIKCRYESLKEFHDKKIEQDFKFLRDIDQQALGQKQQIQLDSEQNSKTQSPEKRSQTEISNYSDLSPEKRMFDYECVKDPVKLEQMKQLEKKLRKETIAPHEIRQALSKFDKNVIIKSHVSRIYQSSKQNQLLKTQNNFSSASQKNSILQDIGEVKKKMTDEMFLKSLGADLRTIMKNNQIQPLNRTQIRPMKNQEQIQLGPEPLKQKINLSQRNSTKNQSSQLNQLNSQNFNTNQIQKEPISKQTFARQQSPTLSRNLRTQSEQKKEILNNNKNSNSKAASKLQTALISSKGFDK